MSDGVTLTVRCSSLHKYKLELQQVDALKSTIYLLKWRNSIFSNENITLSFKGCISNIILQIELGPSQLPPGQTGQLYVSSCHKAQCSIIVCLGSLFKNALNQLGDDFNDVIPPVNIYWKVGR